MKILIADDDSVTLSLLEETLSKAGYEVVSVTNGQDAWHRLGHGDIRLVLTDWYMPRIDGIDLCKMIRSSKLPGYVYIIILTSHDKKQNIITGLSAGADDFLSKPFDPEELKLRLRIGERILSAESRDVTIFTMVKMAESRDPETGLHLERMRKYSGVLATHLGRTEKYRDIVTSDYCYNIYLASPLHDIGKLCIPDCVLLKPGSLSNDEWEIMKTHSQRGGETLDSALEEFPGIAYLEVARDIAWSHHEKYDGSGYPRRLRGDEIPLSAQIVALADVYDAVTSKRVYKEAFTPHVARSIVMDGKGKHFSPDIVDAFLATEQIFQNVQKELSEKSDK
ncbi:MAG: response regulator [bacterium]